MVLRALAFRILESVEPKKVTLFFSDSKMQIHFCNIAGDTNLILSKPTEDTKRKIDQVSSFYETIVERNASILGDAMVDNSYLVLVVYIKMSNVPSRKANRDVPSVAGSA